MNETHDVLESAKSWLGKVELGEGRHFRNLTVFPLLVSEAGGPAPPRYELLSDAIEAGEVGDEVPDRPAGGGRDDEGRVRVALADGIDPVTAPARCMRLRRGRRRGKADLGNQDRLGRQLGEIFEVALVGRPGDRAG